MLSADESPNPDDQSARSGSRGPQSSEIQFPEIPEDVTSFGGAIVDDALYIYGGHTGQAHSYSHETQAHTLWRLDLKQPKAWQAVAEGPHLQGLALVAWDGKLYRIGGFTAKNKEGEEHDLWSQASVAVYRPQADSDDAASGKWQELSPLPEPRSSFDAAVLDGKLYVIGGWQMQGDQETKWHETAWSLDLTDDNATWQKLPEPPFQRRALAVAAHQGKIYAIGGMQQEGGPTTRVDVFDPKTGKWSQGPSLKGEPMEGFGGSAFATGGRLYVSTINGNLQQLSDDGQSWETVQQLERARFFHRMLPFSKHALLSVGGANMESGKFSKIDVIEVQ